MTTPTTAAGRAYVGDGGAPKFRERRLYHTLRIEAEARAAALDEARAAAERLRRKYVRLPEDGADSEDAAMGGMLNEALAAIDALREGSR